MFVQIRTATLWLVSVCMVLVPGFSRAEETPNDRRLPIGTVAYFSIRDVSQMKAGLGRSMLGKLFEDPAMQPLMQELHTKLADGLKEFESSAGFSLQELSSIPQGEVSLAVTLPPTGGQFAFAMFLNYSGSEEAFRKVFDRMQRGMDEQGIRRIEEEIEGSPVTLIEVPANDSPIKMAPAYFIQGSTLVFASHTDLVNAVLTRWDGKHDETLADNEAYRYISERCRGESGESSPAVVWFFDPLAILKGGLNVNPQMAFQAAMAMGIIQQIGVDKLAVWEGSIEMAHGDYDGLSRTFMMVLPSPRGIMNMMQFEEGALGPPQWVAADVIGYSSTRWNLAKAYSTVESLVDMFAGPGTTARQLNEMAQNEQLGKLHLKQDFVDQLTGTYQTMSDQVGEGENARQRMLLALELRNAAAMKNVLARIAGIEGFPGKQREFQGETIYEFSIPEGAFDGFEVPNLTQLQAGNDAGEGGSSVGVAIAEQRLLIGFDVTLLEQVIRGLGDRERLSDAPVYKKVAGRFPARAAAISFSRGDLQLKAMLEGIKSGLRQAATSQIDLDFDLSKLPDYEVLKKYTSPSGSYMEVDSKGIRWTSFSLKNDD